jgi:hypothetical protein
MRVPATALVDKLSPSKQECRVQSSTSFRKEFLSVDLWEIGRLKLRHQLRRVLLFGVKFGDVRARQPRRGERDERDWSTRHHHFVRADE